MTGPGFSLERSLGGRRVRVTGGTAGIGLAVAGTLLGHGARVCIVGRRPDVLEAALHDLRAQGSEVFGLTADTAHPDDLRGLFGELGVRWGGLDVLVNNAAVRGTPFWDEDAEGADHLLRVNAGGYVACAHLAAPSMRGRRGTSLTSGP